ncbi:MAG: DUF3362 domain-containing protein, partial [Candidatus Thiodiazotropha sp. (ex Lucinoma kastoroae)]|nr:DUF3362 domain-containing protein [Candidatus Thiodiazotropha sp. (ex Lucinoma kastoroae)]
MGRTDLIGKGKKHLVPGWQPNRDGNNNRSEKAFRSGSSRHPKKSSIQGNNVSRKKGRQR